MIYIRDLAEKICQTIDIRNPVGTGGDLDKYSLQEWAESQGGGKTAVASVAVWTRAMLGLEPSEVSALFFLDYCKSGGGLMKMRSDHKNGGQYMRVVQGEKEAHFTPRLLHFLPFELALKNIILTPHT